ncbi:P-loop NTPase family protein [Winogradskyella alexanderae]|uniref:HprK-related kinase B n=1 Tax=Winogradskyella alexanderae TaxID=2877123 RepID=A0ABS7XR27_9FLAO|nr:hypothetical protein [Winogradskyella alexanderae]MCA0132453.1 hypothetical protein [Winogradskyella alexanderae]
MKNELAPTYSFLCGEYWVLWYAVSNSYSIVDSNFKSVLDLYLEAKNEDDFLMSIKPAVSDQDSQTITNQIRTYLESCNSIIEPENIIDIKLNNAHRYIKKKYLINEKSIVVYCDSELVLSTIHPQLAHLETELEIQPDVIFDVYLKNEHLYMFKNDICILRTPKKDYHFLRGKFVMHVFCEIYNKKVADWLGTFHGSTVTDNKSAILFSGASGSGKSTISTLLASNGFYLLADDVSPMLAEDRYIYHNPNGVSIKESASKLLRPLIKGFDNLPTANLNPTKGLIYYHTTTKPSKISYPCKAIVLVNYKSNARTDLEEVSIKSILETLIPESWLSPDPEHAQKFLGWMTKVKRYKLTYSDTNEMIEMVSDIFREEE